MKVCHWRPRAIAVTAAFAVSALISATATASSPNTSESTSAPLPASFDWRDKGAVGPVYDQAQCGDPYQFTAAAALEGAWFVKTGKLNSYTQTDLAIRGVPTHGNNGCEGGWFTNGTAGTTFPAADLQGWSNLPRGDVAAMKKALVEEGPLAAAMYMPNAAFYYKSGVFNPTAHECAEAAATGTYHAVAIIGYGVDAQSGIPYWIVKNSWGTQWGEKGFARIAAGSNACGIEEEVNYPVVHPVVHDLRHP